MSCGAKAGEVAFIEKMIAESKAFGRQVKWFTTLVSRGDNFTASVSRTDRHRCGESGEERDVQGQKQSRFIGWTFMDDAKRRRPLIGSEPD